MTKCLLTDGRGIDSLKFTERKKPEKLNIGEVLVQVHAVSLNYRDLMVARGDYGGSYDPPIVACTDFSGTVTHTADNVSELKPGDRVINHPFKNWPSGNLDSKMIRSMVGGLGVDGVLIEQIVYPATALVKVPTHMTFEEASTLPIAGLTAWAAVVVHGKVRPGEWVLTHGSGGVSIFAAQIAKALGALVILSSSRQEKSEQVRKRVGVDAVINYKDENWVDQVKEITGGKGTDVVVDTAGGDVLTKSILASGYSSRIAIIGNIADRSTAFKLFDIVRRQISLRGIFMESCEELKSFAAFCENSKLNPWLDRVFLFGQSIDAFRHLESQNHIGKIVIKVN
jgi:NADPH:quinone reductase-like Zn-dependent oxidoreductase